MLWDVDSPIAIMKRNAHCKYNFPPNPNRLSSCLQLLTAYKHKAGIKVVLVSKEVDEIETMEAVAFTVLEYISTMCTD